MANSRLRDLVPAPRKVPTTGILSLFFGGQFSLFGWIFFGFSTIFIWGFAARESFDLVAFSGEKAQTTAIVKEVIETNFSVCGSKYSRGTPVYCYKFEFSDSSGEKHIGTCYSTGMLFENGKSYTI